MGRRKHKQRPKAANLPKIGGVAEESLCPSGISTAVENPAGPLNISKDAEELMSSPLIPDEEVDLTSFVSVLSDAENLANPPGVSSDKENLAASPTILKNAKSPASVTPTGADRRTHPRYEFIASAEIVAAESGARMAMRVRDLSQQGCYVDTEDALPLGTVTDVHIAKGAQRFEARARVVYSRAGKGMGLMFTAAKPEQLHILDSWLAESRETSWLAANRRRSQRVLVTVPVRVSGQLGAGASFEEDSHTRAISAHGALILLSAQVHRGQRLTLSNVQTKAALECVVAHIDRRQRDQPQVGVEFALPNPMFWHVAFPPKDWTPRHPDAKSPIKTRESI
jgi:hypothetical protein